jgi:hypothetical protein
MIMAKETAAQRRERYARLLADYDELNSRMRKDERDMKALKDQVREIPAGTYGEWLRSLGTPRVITDMDAVREDYAARQLELPTKETEPPIVVRHVAATNVGKHRARRPA